MHSTQYFIINDYGTVHVFTIYFIVILECIFLLICKEMFAVPWPVWLS